MKKPDFDVVSTINYKLWNRKTLNAYWLILLLAFLAEMIGAFIVYTHNIRPIHDYLVETVLKPTLITTFTLLVVEWINKRFSNWSNYLLIATGSLLAYEFISIQPKVSGVQTALILPILVSVFYFQWRKIIFSYALNLIALLLLYTFAQQYASTADWREIISTFTLMTCSVFLANGIMVRGGETQRYLVHTMRDQQELIAKNVIMENIAKLDALTELYNHKTFHEHLEKLIEQSDPSDSILQLAILDIDNFKKINDTYGHWVGDLILKEVAQLIKGSLSMNDFAARYGGEEFTIIFSDKTEAQALQAIEHIRIEISQCRPKELNGENVTISIGLQTYIHGTDKEVLFKGADSALYSAKRNGKNQTVVHR